MTAGRYSEVQIWVRKMRVSIWKDPSKDRYFFGIEHGNKVLSSVMADFFGPPESIGTIIEIIKKFSEFIEKGEENIE